MALRQGRQVLRDHLVRWDAEYTADERRPDLVQFAAVEWVGRDAGRWGAVDCLWVLFLEPGRDCLRLALGEAEFAGVVKYPFHRDARP